MGTIVVHDFRGPKTHQLTIDFEKLLEMRKHQPQIGQKGIQRMIY
jgi:hypothetical protein